MENENVVILRLYSGEMLIGAEDPCAKGEGVTLLDPRVVVMVPTMRGDVHVAMKPVAAPFASPRLEKSLTVRPEQVMFRLEPDEIDKELVNGYKSEVAGIRIASVADTMAINQNKQGGGDFVL